MADLVDFEASEVFSPLEKAVLAYAKAMSATPAKVNDELYARLKSELDDRQMVELSATIAWENYRARFNKSFQIPAQGFSENSFCVVPARK